MTVDGVRYVFKDLETTAQWSTETVLIGADDRDDGRNNMAVVKSIANWKELYPAFALVDALNVDGVTGWYLPAVYEFVKNGYEWRFRGWSSTERSYGEAYNYNTNNAQSKNVSSNIVAIHRF